MNVNLQFASDVLHYCCCYSIRNVAFNVFCKYFSGKETFATLSSGCKEHICGQILLWIVKCSKVALFKEGLTVLKILQRAHPDIYPAKDWEKLELGIKLKIILEQILSGSSTSQCLETFQQFFPTVNAVTNEDESYTERSLPALLYQLIKDPSEKNSVSHNLHFQNEVGSNLIHTITHRVKHLVRNLQRTLPFPSFIEICKGKMSHEQQRMYHLMEEGKLTSHQIGTHLEIQSGIDEEKLFAAVRQLFESYQSTGKSGCDCSLLEKKTAKVKSNTASNRSQSKERDVLNRSELNATTCVEVVNDPTATPSSHQDVAFKGHSFVEGRRASSLRGLNTGSECTNYEQDLKRACMDSKVTVVLKRMTLSDEMSKMGRNEKFQPLHGSERSSGPSNERSPVLLSESSPELHGERSPALWSDESPVLLKDKSPPTSIEVSNLDDGSLLLMSVNSKSLPDNSTSLKRKQNVQTKDDMKQKRSKVRRVSECSSDSIEYFCSSRGNSAPESDVTGLKENMDFTANKKIRTSFEKKVASDELKFEDNDDSRSEDVNNQLSDHAVHRQVCRKIRNVSENSSEEREEVLSPISDGDCSDSSKKSSEELLVVKSFYSNSFGRLKNYKWRSNHEMFKGPPNYMIASDPLRHHSTERGKGLNETVIKKRMTRSKFPSSPSTRRGGSLPSRKHKTSQRETKGRETSGLTSSGEIYPGSSKVTSSPVFEYRYSSSGSSSSNPSISILTGKRVLFAKDQDIIQEITPQKELSPVLWSSSHGNSSSHSSKSDFSSEEMRFVLETLSEEREDDHRRVMTTPISRNTSFRNVLISSSSSELQNAQRSQTQQQQLAMLEEEDSIPDSDHEDEDEGGDTSGSQTLSHLRFPSLVQYLSIAEANPTLRPCSVTMNKIKLEEMRLRVLLSQGSQ